jgi:hypothetical protein
MVTGADNSGAVAVGNLFGAYTPQQRDALRATMRAHFLANFADSPFGRWHAQ